MTHLAEVAKLMKLDKYKGPLRHHRVTRSQPCKQKLSNARWANFFKRSADIEEAVL